MCARSLLISARRSAAARRWPASCEHGWGRTPSRRRCRGRKCGTRVTALTCGSGCCRSTRRWPPSRRCDWTPVRAARSHTARPSPCRLARPAACGSTAPTAVCSASRWLAAASSNRNGSSMRILRGLPSFPPELAPSVVALGAFDGIHLAHAKIIATAVARARELTVSSVVRTFDPNPTAVLRPDRAPAPISTLDENLARIAEQGPDAALIIPFTLAFSKIEAEAFVDEVLCQTLGAREVVIGFNHTFGRG